MSNEIEEAFEDGAGSVGIGVATNGQVHLAAPCVDDHQHLHTVIVATCLEDFDMFLNACLMVREVLVKNQDGNAHGAALH